LHRAEITETIVGYGHVNIQATHHATLEFTKEAHVSKNGDCILVVSADKGLSDLSEEFKEALQKAQAKLSILIEVDGVSEIVNAQGNPRLALTHPVEMVIRKSEYVSDRTLAVHADKAAKDLSRALVEKLKNPRQKATITLTVHG
jgi:hypothetical protein